MIDGRNDHKGAVPLFTIIVLDKKIRKKTTLMQVQSTHTSRELDPSAMHCLRTVEPAMKKKTSDWECLWTTNHGTLTLALGQLTKGSKGKRIKTCPLGSIYHRNTWYHQLSHHNLFVDMIIVSSDRSSYSDGVLLYIQLGKATWDFEHSCLSVMFFSSFHRVTSVSSITLCV